MPTRERSALDVVLRCFVYAIGAETGMLLRRVPASKTQVLAIWGLGERQPYTRWVTNSLLGRAFDAPGAVVEEPSRRRSSRSANGVTLPEAAVAAPVIGPAGRLGAIYAGFSDDPPLPSERLGWMADSYAGLAALCMEAGDGLSDTLLASGVDRLTGCLSRDAALAALDVEVERARREGGRLSCCLLEVDELGTINDALGFLEGNRVLAAVGRELRAATRSYDAVGRLDGATFMVVLPGMSARSARSSAHRLQPRISASIAKTARFPSAVSAGVAQWGGDESAHTLLAAADRALGNTTPGGRPVVARPAAVDRGRDGLLERTRILVRGRRRSAGESRG